MKILFDTDVLIDHFRGQEFLSLIAPVIHRSQVYISSVVAMELRAGCRSATEVRVLERFLRPFEAAGRVVAPDHRACLRAGAALALLGSRFGLTPDKRRALSHDALIAASAVAIGAAVITRHRSDFALLAQCLPLVWFGSLEEFLAAERQK